MQHETFGVESTAEASQNTAVEVINLTAAFGSQFKLEDEPERQVNPKGTDSVPQKEEQRQPNHEKEPSK